MEDTCQARARKEDIMSTLAHSGGNIMTEERRRTKPLAKEALKQISLSEWPSFMGGLQVVQEDVLCIKYGIFRFEPLHNFHLGISRLLKKYIFT